MQFIKNTLETFLKIIFKKNTILTHNYKNLDIKKNLAHSFSLIKINAINYYHIFFKFEQNL